MTAKRTLPGGCLCGAVRYQIDVEDETSSLCHCTMCRRQSGGAFMGFITVPRSRFRLLHGDIKHFRASEIGARGFCGDCGTPLTMDYDFEPDRTGIVTGSLDTPDAVPPTAHWGVQSMLPWLKLEDDLPRWTTQEDPEVREALKFGKS